MELLALEDQRMVVKAQERYEKYYEIRLRKQSEVIQEDDYVYIRVERKNPK